MNIQQTILQFIALTAIVIMVFSFIRFRLSVVSPPFILFFITSFSLIFGYLFSDPDASGSSISLSVNSDLYIDILIEALIVLISFLLGAIVLYWINENRELEQQYSVILFFEKIESVWAIWFSIFSIVLFIAGSGFFELFNRDYYISDESSVLKSIGSVLSIASLVLLGSTIKKGKIYSYMSIAVSFLIILIYLSYSSRMSALGVIFIALGYYISTPGRESTIVVILALIICPLMLHISLYMRNSFEQGFFPLVSSLLAGHLISSFDMSALLNNIFSVNYAITVLTATQANIDLGYILTSINPLPGFLTDWYSLESGLNFSTPYNMLGEWLNFSFIAALVFYFILGIIFAYIDLRARYGDILFATFGVGVTALVSVMVQQYSTRQSTRLLLYFFVIYITRFFWRSMNSKSSI